MRLLAQIRKFLCESTDSYETLLFVFCEDLRLFDAKIWRFATKKKYVHIYIYLSLSLSLSLGRFLSKLAVFFLRKLQTFGQNKRKFTDLAEPSFLRTARKSTDSQRICECSLESALLLGLKPRMPNTPKAKTGIRGGVEGLNAMLPLSLPSMYSAVSGERQVQSKASFELQHRDLKFLQNPRIFAIIDVCEQLQIPSRKLPFYLRKSN